MAYSVLAGTVVEGDHRGRQLGFPTANVEVAGPGEADLPPDGIYEGWLEDAAGTRRAAAISIGGRPTYYTDGAPRLVEAYVLDFEGDLYGQHVRVGVGRVVREQVRFSTTGELVDQMRRDVEVVRAVAASRHD